MGEGWKYKQTKTKKGTCGDAGTHFDRLEERGGQGAQEHARLEHFIAHWDSNFNKTQRNLSWRPQQFTQLIWVHCA